VKAPEIERKFLKVKVIPSSKRQAVRILGGDSFLVEVRSPAVKNQANSECLEALARLLDCNPKSLRIFRGARSPHKLIEWKKEG
jgi:uncharacterized protein YggU (UPF0235/DUF167 family)